MNLLCKTKELVLNTLFPPFCVGCGKEGRYICQLCHVFAGEAALICPGCSEASYTGQTHKNYKCYTRYVLDGLAAPWEYEGVVKKLLHLAKYGGIAHALQELVRSSLQVMAADQARFGTFFEFLLTLPLVTYVPMFLTKEKHRGFNQAKFIAKEIVKVLSFPQTSSQVLLRSLQVLDVLVKTKNTPTQTNLTREERAENVRDSFGLETFSSLPDRVVLVDDIYTTGATMEECCRVLKKAGAKEVWGFALSRTV